MRRFDLAILCSALATCARPSSDARPPGPEIAVLPPSVDAGRAPADPAIDEPREPSEHRDHAWLRERWPEQTRNITFSSLAPKLSAWVKEGDELRAFFTMDGRRCQPVVLRRTSDGGELDALHGRIIESETTLDGGTERTFIAASFGHQLHVQSGGGTERFDGKEWVQHSGWGIGDGGSTLSVLSDVDAQSARWEGVAVRFEAHCNGPMETLPCAGGGSRACDACEDVALSVHDYRPSMMGYGVARTIRGPTPGCSEPCPPASNPAIPRLAASTAFSGAWRRLSGDDRPDPVPTLYRSEARCLKESRPD